MIYLPAYLPPDTLTEGLVPSGMDVRPVRAPTHVCATVAVLGRTSRRSGYSRPAQGPMALHNRDSPKPGAKQITRCCGSALLEGGVDVLVAGVVRPTGHNRPLDTSVVAHSSDTRRRGPIDPRWRYPVITTVGSRDSPRHRFTLEPSVVAASSSAGAALRASAGTYTGAGRDEGPLRTGLWCSCSAARALGREVATAGHVRSGQSHDLAVRIEPDHARRRVCPEAGHRADLTADGVDEAGPDGGANLPDRQGPSRGGAREGGVR